MKEKAGADETTFLNKQHVLDKKKKKIVQQLFNATKILVFRLAFTEEIGQRGNNIAKMTI